MRPPRKNRFFQIVLKPCPIDLPLDFESNGVSHVENVTLECAESPKKAILKKLQSSLFFAVSGGSCVRFSRSRLLARCGGCHSTPFESCVMAFVLFRIFGFSGGRAERAIFAINRKSPPWGSPIERSEHPECHSNRLSSSNHADLIPNMCLGHQIRL